MSIAASWAENSAIHVYDALFRFKNPFAVDGGKRNSESQISSIDTIFITLLGLERTLSHSSAPGIGVRVRVSGRNRFV